MKHLRYISVLLRKSCSSSASHGHRWKSTSVVNEERLVQHPAGVSRLEIGQAANMLDIGIRNILNEQHDTFREKARLFFQENVIPYHDTWQKQQHCPKELFTMAGSLGLLGVDTPVEYGGAGRDFLSSMIMLEEQFYSNCSGPGFQMHSDIVMQYIYKYGSNEQRERYLPDMGAGRIIGGLAMTEPNAGSDVQRIQTRAKEDGTDWILNGAKVFITNGHLLDVVIVAAVTEPTAKRAAHGTTLFLVDYGKEGFNKGRILHKIGMKAQDTSELFFDDVRLPASSLLGQLNKGFYYLMDNLPRERVLVSVMGQCSMEAMFEFTRACLKQNHPNRLKSQTVQHKLAEIKTAICIGRAFLDMSMELCNKGKLDSQTASMGKWWHSDTQQWVIKELWELCGDIEEGSALSKAVLDGRAQPIYGGTNEIMKELIARTIVRD